MYCGTGWVYCITQNTKIKIQGYNNYYYYYRYTHEN